MEETAQVDQRRAQGITHELNNAGHPVGVEDVLPIGDAAHWIGGAVGGVTVGSPNTRTAPSKNFLGEVVKRLLQKRGPSDVVVVK